MRELKIGMIGTGWINSVHARSLAKLPGVAVTALYNHRSPKADAFNATHFCGRAAVYDDWRRMLETETLDAVYVALPPGANCGQAELAAERGCHLMLEKPIALTNERATSIAAAVDKAGVLCQIGHHMRHSAPVIKLKQMIEDGSAGRPLLMQGRFFTNGLFPTWWRDPALGGGQLIEQAIHIYDLARHFLGEPRVVMALADNLNHGRFADYRVDDVSAATIGFRNGAIASLCASNCTEPKGGSIAFSVHCQNVAVEFKSPDDATFIFHGGKKSEEVTDPPAREHVVSNTNVYDELSANFIGAIRGQTTLRSGIADGVNGLRLVLAAAASARASGQSVTL